MRADPDSVLAATAVLDALRFSSVLVPASTGENSEVKFIDDPDTASRILTGVGLSQLLERAKVHMERE